LSLFDILKGKKKENIRHLIGADSVEEYCLVNYSGTKTAYLIIAPVNLNVLSKSVIKSMVENLGKSVVEIGASEFLCINSAQSYESNKHLLSQRILREQNEELKEIDRQDIAFLDDIQTKMATSREFLLPLHFTSVENIQQVSSALERARQIMMQNGFTVRVAGKHDIKRMFAIYFEQNIHEEEMQDFDGERYAPILEMKK
jgi:hypothetical protein